ncbi:MAG: putative GH43/DUF377 family glycosyl hydrolase [Gammaproteobacteria bacterium]
MNSWDDYYAIDPTVIHNGTEYERWYTGNDSVDAALGHAASPDAITWTKELLNPILSKGAPNEWDDSFIASPSVFYNGTNYYMWYSGGALSSGVWKIGYATSN